MAELIHKELTSQILNAAMEVHTQLGPGLLESVYEACMAYELGQRGLSVSRQLPVPVVYKGEQLDCGFRLDLLVEGVVIVELKTVEKILPVHESQLFTHMRLLGCRVGLLLNFNVQHLRDGIVRRVL
jgi:GxxExxY protein